MNQIQKYVTQYATIIKSCNYSNGKEVVGAYKWLVKNGELFTKVDEELSTKLSKDCRIKECYRNCWQVLDSEPNLQYYQGYAVDKNGFVFDHTFLVKNNMVVDPTMAITGSQHERQSKKYFTKGNSPEIDVENRFAVQYFGVKITKKELHQLISSTKMLDNFIVELYKRRVLKWKN